MHDDTSQTDVGDEVRERVPVAKDWLAKTASDLHSFELPSGKLGDYIFLLRDMLADLAAKPALSNPPAAVESNGNAEAEFPSWTDEDEAYGLGRRDGYELAVQDIDLATGGDGEFKGSTIPGETVDVSAMKARIIGRFAADKSAEARLRVKTSDGFEVETLQSGRITKIISGPYTEAFSAVGAEANKSEGCICQNQHRRGYCTEPGCPYAVRPSSQFADEAKKSEGGVEGHAATSEVVAEKARSVRQGSSRGFESPDDSVGNEAVARQAGIKPGPSDPTAERREIVARIIIGDTFDELMAIADSYGPYQKYRDQLTEVFTKADAILAALNEGVPDVQES